MRTNDEQETCPFLRCIIDKRRPGSGSYIRDGLRVFMGYDFLYLSDMLRPGKQIDRTINFSQTADSIAAGNGFTAGSRPTLTLTSSEFWAQGITFGVELGY